MAFLKRWMTLSLVAAMLGCSGGVSREIQDIFFAMSGRIPDVPGEVAQLSGSPLLEEITAKGPYPGFDTSVYPGDGNMRAWLEHAGYHWVGFYLPAPCHKDASWQGKRSTLESMGWGLAVVYVGQQTWGRTPRAGARVPTGTSCSTNLLSEDRGRVDADDAIARTAAEGFPPGPAIFLDLERMERVPNAMRDYYVAWTERVLDDGRYRPAFYAHTHNAQRVYDDVRALLDSRGNDSEPPFWIAGGQNFERDRSPTEVGPEFAAVWQGKLDKWERHAAVRLPIDLNVAMVPSPSSAQFAD